MPAAKLWSVVTAGMNAIKIAGSLYTRRRELSMREKDAGYAEIIFLGIVGIGVFVYGLIGLLKTFKKG